MIVGMIAVIVSSFNENRWICVHALQFILIVGEIVYMFSSSVWLSVEVL
jgi:hypothetical protein